MNRKSSIAIFLLSSVILLSQNKQDYIWPLGLDWNGGIILDFNSNPMQSYSRNGELGMSRTVATICNDKGELLFYCNGWAVANKNHEVMPNGLGINDGRYFQEFQDGNWVRGSLLRQDMIVLPDPSDSMGYYIIHKTREYNPDQDTIPRFTMESMKYSYIDMRLDNGLGDITEKDMTFFEERIQADYLTAIPKSNGTEWWIINPSQLDNRYFMWSLTQDGIVLQDSQQIGILADEECISNTLGDARFSPDGTKYAYFNLCDGLSIFDFDRATGQLSNLRRLDWEPYNEWNWAGSIEFSPNSRYIYI